MTVFKQLLNDYKQCLIRGDHSDGAAAYLALVDEYEQAARRTTAVPVPQSIEQMAVDRYKVVPSHESMFHRWAVVAGNGTQQLYIGREVECQNMALKFAGAFLDGAFVAMQNTAPAHPVEGVQAAVPEGWKLAPIKPTPEMCHVGRYGGDKDAPAYGEKPVEGVTAWPFVADHTAEQIYQSMLAAAPAHPAEGVPAQAGPVGYVALAALTSRTHADDYAKCFATEAALLENYPAAKAIAVFDHAATQPAAQAVQPFGWLITKSKLPGDMEFTQDPMRENLARSFGYQTQALYDQPAAQGMDARDAKRYRWLRECNSGSLVVVEITGTGDEDWHVLTEADADAAIDAALAAQAVKQGEN